VDAVHVVTEEAAMYIRRLVIMLGRLDESFPNEVQHLK
jgi:hypothetical protein